MFLQFLFPREFRVLYKQYLINLPAFSTWKAVSATITHVLINPGTVACGVAKHLAQGHGGSEEQRAQNKTQGFDLPAQNSLQEATLKEEQFLTCIFINLPRKMHHVLIFSRAELGCWVWFNINPNG